MSVQQNNSFSSPYVGFVTVMSEIISPLARAIGTGIVKGFDYYMTKRAAYRSVPAFAAHRAFPAPHVALMMVPSEFVTQPFRKY